VLSELVVAHGPVASDTAPSANERLVLLLKALADPRRLSIFDMLMDGVQCNCEIAARLDISLSLVSYHLKILSEAGLLRSEPDPDDARWLYYSINPDALEELQRGMGRLLDIGRIQPRQPCCGPRGCKDR
jgi:ArsR family transcriptional regulator, arsenate/arsenite/antimonite-responsive transcriptional repressor